MEGRGLIGVAVLAFTIIIAVGCVIAFLGTSLTGDATDFAWVAVVMGRLAAYGLVAFTFILMFLKARGDGGE